MTKIPVRRMESAATMLSHLRDIPPCPWKEVELKSIIGKLPCHSRLFRLPPLPEGTRLSARLYRDYTRYQNLENPAWLMVKYVSDCTDCYFQFLSESENPFKPDVSGKRPPAEEFGLTEADGFVTLSEAQLDLFAPVDK